MNGLFRFGSTKLNMVLTVVFLFLQSIVSSANMSSSYFSQIAYLLPSGVTPMYLGKNSDLSKKIDEVVLKILSTPTGGQLCKAFPDNQDLIHNSILTNETSAIEAYKLCQKYFSTNKKNYFRPFAKKYFLVVLSDNFKAKLTGWTTPRNETYIFVNESDYKNNFIASDLKLIKILSHELAMSLDRKDAIGFTGILDFGKIGILKTDHNNDFISISRDAYIKHALASVRAFDFENHVIKDLGYSISENYTEFNKLNCHEKIDFIYPYISQISKSVQSEQFVNMLMDISGPSIYSSSEISVSKKIERLNEIIIYFENQSEKNACDYMTQGVPFEGGTSFRGGPGPRIEGW